MSRATNLTRTAPTKTFAEYLRIAATLMIKARLALPALSLCQRMDLDHVGALGETLRRNPVFIRRTAGIAQVEIVFKMLMSADE
jgi:hypothetical protein